MFVPESNLLEPVHVKKNRQFWKKLKSFFCKVLTMAKRLRIKKTDFLMGLNSKGLNTVPGFKPV